MTSFAIVLVSLGIAVLCYALKPTTAICNNVESQRVGWQCLYGLILFFIIGYFLFAAYIFSNQNTGIIEIIIGCIFFFGAIFVALVAHLSLLTILSLNHAALLVQQQIDIDQLTGLPNRHYFNQLLSAQANSQHQENYSLLLIDLNKFKLINNLLGHQAGDLLLIEFAQRLKTFASHHINVCRLGGDEFVMLARKHNHEQLVWLAKEINELITPAFTINDQEINVKISIGIANSKDNIVSEQTLLKQADIAMNYAKNNRKVIEFYSDKLAAQVSDINDKLHQLERAILSSELFLHYQPIIDSKTRQVVSVEALTRWIMHDGTEVSPTEFIPLAQSNNLIHSITSFVVDEALAQLAKWHQQKLMLKINVNLSASDFQDVFLAQRLINLLAHYKVEAKYLTLEITEGVLIENIDRAKENINILRDAGVNIALDDFGTGFSSLDYLRTLNINQLKLDYSFTRNVLDQHKDLAIMESTIKLAHQLGCSVTAEGVESEALNDKLSSIECDFLQGHWLCVPKSAQEVTQYILTTGVYSKTVEPTREPNDIIRQSTIHS